MSTGWQPYQQWYPYFYTHIYPQFADKCATEMLTPHTVDAWCQKGADCIYTYIDSFTQTSLAGASVMLGLAPATLALVGPSDKSLAFLSSERPLLSMLIASSTATLSVGYPFSRESPLQALSDALETPWSVDDLLPRGLASKPWLISAMQYLLVAAATANTVQLSYDVTRKTIVSWSCPNWAWVLCWSFVPLFLHVVGLIIFRVTVKRDRRARFNLTLNGSAVDAEPRSLGGRAWQWMVDKELRPCSERVLPKYTIKYSLASQLLWWAPRVGSYLQYLMGTAIFSSLLFIPISDAFPLITRYAVSSMAARCVLGMEMQSLRRLNKSSHSDGMVVSPRLEQKFVGFEGLHKRSVTVNAEVVA